MIMTPLQYIQYSLVSFPILYKKDSFKDTKIAIYDQLFNTVVNGIDGSKEWIKEIIWFYKMALIEIEDNKQQGAFPQDNQKRNDF